MGLFFGTEVVVLCLIVFWKSRDITLSSSGKAKVIATSPQRTKKMIFEDILII